ncbi:MAG: hypothetical protein ACK5ME_11025 [Parahaliea sp.]
MDAYFIGNLVGRLLVSIVLVYIVLLAFSQFDFRRAGRRLKGVGPVIAVLLVFILGIAGSTLQS